MGAYSSAWPCAHSLARPAVRFRESPADFIVEEQLGFSLTGEGEHVWLRVEKTALNTVEVAAALARTAGCRPADVGYAGLKDRQAVARQWFSLKLAREFPLTELAEGRIRVLEQVRNARKLRRGSHRGNRFCITVHDAVMGQDYLHEAAGILRAHGVPNYFGLQRFGHDGSNVEKAAAMFAGKLPRVTRFQRGICLSAARAWLFNQELAIRVRDGNWDRFVSGDVMALQGSGSIFVAAADDPALEARLLRGDIHPTGALWGVGEPPSLSAVSTLEHKVADTYPELASGLQAAGLEQQRRPLRVLPENLSLSPAGKGELVIEFALPPGAFATSVLREIVTAAGL